MHKTTIVAAFLAFATLLPMAGTAQQAIRWESNLDVAQREAARTNRPVLMFFYSTSCTYCRRMENEVLNQPAVVNEVNANYVAVSINVNNFPRIAQQYHISHLPTSIILSPQGQVVEFKEGYVALNDFAARLNQIAAAGHRSREAVYAQIPAGAIPPANQQQIANPQAVASMQPQPNYGAPAAAATVSPSPYYSSQGQATQQPVAQQQPMMQQRPAMQQPAMQQQPAAAPTLALDGYCPVSLCEKQQWVPGNRQWGANHHGQIYLFAGPEEQRKFLANPDHYAPIASGNDIVLASEQGQSVPGLRKFGYFCDGRVYLFSCEATMLKFRSNPMAYTRQTADMYRANANPNQQWR